MIQLGIAPIGWTNDDMPELGGEITFEQCVSEMALAGYTGCEVGNKFPTHDWPLLKHHLNLRSLQICNQWFTYEFTTKTLDEVKTDFITQLEFLQFFGAKVIGGAECGNAIHGNYHQPLSQNGPASKEAWDKLILGLNELGKLAWEEYGIQLAYHHHMGTMVESIADVERLLAATDDKYVQLNYDCGHFYFANQDPEEALVKFISRTAHVHFKDVRNSVKERVVHEDLSFLKAVKLGVYTVPGDGDMHMQPLATLLKDNQYKGWVVVEAEQDPSIANPLEYALKGYDYLKNTLNL